MRSYNTIILRKTFSLIMSICKVGNYRKYMMHDINEMIPYRQSQDGAEDRTFVCLVTCLEAETLLYSLLLWCW